MHFTLVFFALVPALVTVHANILFSTSPKPADDIEALCDGDDVALTKLKHLKLLAVKVIGSSCSNQVGRAIEELPALVEAAKYDPCSSDAIDRFRDYYVKYVETSSSSGKGRERLPKSLKRFVLAFGLQMSNACKENMVRNLIFLKNAWLLHVAADDMVQIDKLIKEDGPVAQMLGKLASADAIFHPGDLAQFLSGRLKPQEAGASSETGNDQLFVQAVTGDQIRRLKAVCKLRLRPVYEPLMEPLVRLANLGFDHKSQPLKCELDCPRVNAEMARWSRKIFMCESLKGINLVESPSAGEDGKSVRILTKQEAAAAMAGKSLDELEGIKPLPKQQATYYRPQESVMLDGKIFDYKDKRLIKAIESFKTGRSEAAVIRARIKAKGRSLIKQELKEGHFKLLMSAAVKSLMGRKSVIGAQTLEPSEELAKILDEAGETSNLRDDAGLLSLGLLIVFGRY